MRTIVILLCGALAACSQTGPSQTASRATVSPTGSPAGKSVTKTNIRQASSGEKCQDAVARTQQQQMNSAMLGSALSMVGGLGGFGGRGGAAAAQAVSVGGSVMQAQARNDARNAIQQECLS